MWLENSGDGVLFFVDGNSAPKDASEALVTQQGSDCEKG
jgi:hypothetical protein